MGHYRSGELRLAANQMARCPMPLTLEYRDDRTTCVSPVALALLAASAPVPARAQGEDRNAPRQFSIGSRGARCAKCRRRQARVVKGMFDRAWVIVCATRASPSVISVRCVPAKPGKARRLRLKRRAIRTSVRRWALHDQGQQRQWASHRNERRRPPAPPKALPLMAMR